MPVAPLDNAIDALAEALKVIPVPESWDDYEAAVARSYETDAAVILAALQESGWKLSPIEDER